MTGTVEETYVAAVQHDLVDLEGATPIGVVRRPTGWFNAVVEENVRALGPPEDLLDDVERRREEFAMAGMCDSGAHNAAFGETDFEARYREYLDADAEARAALGALRERVRNGEDVAFVCFEADDKRCHRHALREVLLSELGDGAE